MSFKMDKIKDTFAEAFKMYGARIIITAVSEKWALESARSFTGFATSVIACGCEAGIERTLSPEETPDGRPGVSVLIFAMSRKGLEDQLLRRIGQCVLTCPTTACFNGLESEEVLSIGKSIRFFGDGYQMSKLLDGKRYWRIPVMEGEFLMEESYGVKKAIGGGNILILGESVDAVLRAAEKAVEASRKVKDVILPFPGGIVRSGSKVGSKYKFLKASTNTDFVPQLRAHTSGDLPKGVKSVLEIVFDGFSLEAVKEAMRLAIEAAVEVEGVIQISAGNYGGNLGQYNIYLRELWEGS